MTAPRINGRFSNLDPNANPRFKRVFKWVVVDRVTGRRRKAPPTADIPAVDAPEMPSRERVSALWLGHATALITLGGLRIITDPVFSHRLGPGIVRNGAAPLGAGDFDTIDVVLLSHNHRDHLDKPSVMAIDKAHAPHYVTPLGVDRYLTSWGIPSERITTLDWWAHADIVPDRADLRVTVVPSQHWSQRLPYDRNKTLWGGFVLESDDRRVYFAGDSGYFEALKDIGARFKRFDFGLIPIGAYDPEWFMQPQHMNPEQAGQTMLDVGAERLISIHWGTYKLTDEPLDEPPARLDDWRSAQRIEPERILTLPVGGAFTL